MRKDKLIKVGGILITAIFLSSVIAVNAASLVASDNIITPSKTEKTSKKQETIKEDILPEKEEVVEEKDIVYTTTYLNARIAPGVSSKCAGVIPPNGEILRLEDNSDGWDAIEVAGNKYYVYDTYLTKTKPETIKEVKELEIPSYSGSGGTVSSNEVGTFPNARYEMTVTLTDAQKRDLAALVWLEGRGEPLECQYAIASVVINRMMRSNASFEAVVYAKNQFTPACYISSTTPSQTQIDVVNDICANGLTIPRHVLYFRSSYFFNWSTLVNYKKIGNTCFSSLKSLL